MRYNSISEGRNELAAVVRNYGATPGVLSGFHWQAESEEVGILAGDGGSPGAILIGSAEEVRYLIVVTIPSGPHERIHLGEKGLKITLTLHYSDFLDRDHSQSETFAFLTDPYGFQRLAGMAH